MIAFFIASTLLETNVVTFSHTWDVLFFTLSHTLATFVLIALNTVLAVDLREFQRPESVFLIAFQVVDVDVLIIFQTLAIFSFKLLNVRVADSDNSRVFSTTQSFNFVAAAHISSQFLYSKTPIAIAAPTAIVKIPPVPIAVAMALIPPMIPPVPVINAISPFAAVAIPDTLLITPDANSAIFAAANAPIRAAPNASTID